MEPSTRFSTTVVTSRKWWWRSWWGCGSEEPAEADDVLYEVAPQYNHRPDLLAYDLYGSPKLWWVFAQRNMNTIKDPVFDLESGVKIFLPKGDKLKRLLGI